jgi:hypothetical protein
VPIYQWFALMSHSISYNNVSHTRMCVMTLTSSPPLPLSRPWTGWSMRWFTQSHPLMWGLLVPTSLSLLTPPVSLDTCKIWPLGSSFCLTTYFSVLIRSSWSPPPPHHPTATPKTRLGCRVLPPLRCIHHMACQTLVLPSSPPPPPFFLFFEPCHQLHSVEL